MKKRKILYLFPLAALILSGCTFQEGWETVKGFMGDKVYEPAKTWVENLLGIKQEEKKEEKEDQQGGGQQGGGEHQGEGGGQQGGGGEEQTRNYGTENAPLSVSEALAIVEEECAEENALSKQAMVVEGVIYSAIKTYDYEEGPAFECYLGNDEEQIYIYRVHGAEADKPNFKEGSTLKFRGYAKNYKGTLEFCDNGSEKCTVLSLEKPQGTEAVTGIEFDEQVYELQVGQTKKVTASVLPLDAGNQNYTLSLNNVSPEGCVSLGADNVLTANAVGTAKMVATTEEGGFTAEIDVTVIAAINYGTLENPLTIAEAMAVINKESPTKQTVYVTGEVKRNEAYNTQYKNTEIWLTDGENDFELYGCSLPEGFTPAQPVQNDPALVGKIVVAHGTAKKYSSTYELDKGCAIDTVSEPAPIVIESVTVTPSTLELEVGEQANISATVSPAKANQEVTWKVQNPDTYEVANYQDGKIIAVAAGEATVVATSVADDKVSGLCSVVVTEATKTLENIAITGEATKVVYDEGDDYSAAGLKVMAHYDKGEDVDVTENATVTVSPTKATLGDTKFTVTATYGEKEATKDVAVTVNAVSAMQKAYEAGMALANNGVTSEAYTFSGVCTAMTGNSFFIQDGDYGMYVYNKATANLAVGKTVEVTATLTKYKGLVETKSVSASTVTGDGVLPSALEVTKYDDLGNANLLANAANAVFKSTEGEWTSSYAAIVTFTIGGTDVKVKFDKYGFDEAKAQLLNDATAGDVMNLTGAVTSVVDGVNQLLFCGTSTLTNANKVIASAEVTKSPAEVTVNNSVAISDVEVTVTFADTTTGKGRIKSLTVDTSTVGTATADVTIVGYANTLHFDITVKAADPTPQGSVTVNFNVTTYCDAQSVTAGTKVSSIALDSVVTAAASGTDANTGKMYKSNSNVWEWRFYGSGNGTITISLSGNYVLDSVVIGKATSNYGDPTDFTMTVANNGATFTSSSNFNVKTIVVTYHAA